MKKLIVFLVFLGELFLLSKPVFPHLFWINASEYSPTFCEGSAETKIYFGWGHHYPIDDFLDMSDLDEFFLISPRWRKQKLKPQFKGFLMTVLDLKEKGGYIISATRKPGFYTMYVKNGKIHHKFGPKTGLKKVILSSYSAQYAKALIVAGNWENQSFSNPVGHKLELIPLENPYELKVGDFLPIKVLFKGGPARFARIYAVYSGFSSGDDFAYATSTNSEGVAEIRILHWSQWLIKAVVKEAPPESMKNKCDSLNYTATLTFEIH